jgi:hypothetical protein
LTLSPTTLCLIPMTSTATVAGLPGHFRWDRLRRRQPGYMDLAPSASVHTERLTNTNSAHLRRSSVPPTQWCEARCVYS